MKDTYLLYIDVLGFSELAKDRHREARRLYHLLSSLNVHGHRDFRVIVFSDTMLIYSVIDPLVEQDHRYLVMFSIEFAQNLLYTTIGKGFHFRAVLTYGGFEHSSVGTITRFFGPALVNAYEAEKSIGCTGLFIDRTCQRYNDIFETAPWDSRFDFVFLNQSLERLANGELGALPVPPGDLRNLDAQWHIAKDVRMLQDTHKQMNAHRDPRVRAKFLATWNFYYQRYPRLLQKLAARNFDLEVISRGFDWGPARKRLLEGYRGFGVSAPPLTKLRRIIVLARAAGKWAARSKLEEIGGKSFPLNRPLGPVGDATIVLDVDGRSAVGKLLLSAQAASIPGLSVASTRGGLSICLGQLTVRQERSIREAGEAAVLEVLVRELDVDGYLEPYWD